MKLSRTRVHAGGVLLVTAALAMLLPRDTQGAWSRNRRDDRYNDRNNRNRSRKVSTKSGSIRRLGESSEGTRVDLKARHEQAMAAQRGGAVSSRQASGMPRSMREALARRIQAKRARETNVTDRVAGQAIERRRDEPAEKPAEK